METIINLPDGTNIHTNQSPGDPLPTQAEYTLWDEEEKRINFLKNQSGTTNDEKRYQQQQIKDAQNRLLLFVLIGSGLTNLVLDYTEK